MALSNSGLNFIAQAIVNDGTPTFFNNTNAKIGVGDGITAFSKTQTDLVGTNKLRKSVDANFPTRTNNFITFQATYGTDEANFDWNEWGIFNASSDGVMLSRKVENLGTKNGGTWILTATVAFDTP